MTPDQFLKALALTESDDNPDAWGDHGRAVGRYQVHPDWVFTWSHKYTITPRLSETWDSFISRIILAFYTAHAPALDGVHIAMYFHLGHPSRPDAADWDFNYADRFEKAAKGV